jgi:hypothetical protein
MGKAQITSSGLPIHSHRIFRTKQFIKGSRGDQLKGDAFFMEDLLPNVEISINRFVEWLDSYGETSHDYQSFFASWIGGKAKSLYYKRPLLGKLAVAPFVFCEAFLPFTRGLYWHKQRFPIADAHYAMGFAFLSQITGEEKYYHKAVHFLEELRKSRCPGYEYFCWGYPFNWETRNGTMKKDLPLITTTPYAYEAFLSVYKIDNDRKWLEILRSIAEHAFHDIKDFDLSPDAATCSYAPNGHGGVINASAYRSFLLTSASVLFSEEKYWRKAEKNINFILQSQQANGAWFYAIDGIRDFIDHFHTCFVLKALGKIEKLTRHRGCREAIDRGLEYYAENLFNDKGIPKPFSKPPRLTIYKQELYDYAECINLCVLLMDSHPEMMNVLKPVLLDLLSNWQKNDGSFRTRKLYLGWDNVPLHRWAQSQLFRSLCFLWNENRDGQNELKEKR